MPSKAAKRFWWILGFVAVLIGVDFAFGPLSDATLDLLAKAIGYRDRDRFAEAPPHVEPTVRNLEPALLAALRAGSEPQAFRLGGSESIGLPPSFMGYHVTGTIALPSDWPREFADKLASEAIVYTFQGYPLVPVLGFRLSVPDGEAEILTGFRSSTNPHEYRDVMLVALRTKSGVRSIETYLPVRFNGAPDFPDSVIQRVSVYRFIYY